MEDKEDSLDDVGRDRLTRLHHRLQGLECCLALLPQVAFLVGCDGLLQQVERVGGVCLAVLSRRIRRVPQRVQKCQLHQPHDDTKPPLAREHARLVDSNVLVRQGVARKPEKCMGSEWPSAVCRLGLEEEVLEHAGVKR